MERYYLRRLLAVEVLALAVATFVVLVTPGFAADGAAAVPVSDIHRGSSS